jgi:uncharacterized protein YkwD
LKISRISRKATGLYAVALAAALALTGCGTAVHEVGPGAGVSNSARSAIAELRRENGVSPLKPDTGLEKAALRQAGYMARSGEMEHTTGLGRDFVSRMKKDKIHGLRAENIAYGTFGTSKVLDVWMHSPPHRKNMLDARIRRFGLAYVSDGNGRRYWAMVMAD